YDPPTMLVSLYEGARITEALDAAGRWTLSVLREDQEHIARWLGTPGQPIHGLLDRVPLETTASGLPRIAGSLAWFELETVKTVEAAT
ncbi:flavin reductase family protein, partial [Klebsiella pneumoniae]|nr:flavin reductase family protein [Klebsiella pneumoniae]